MLTSGGIDKLSVYQGLGVQEVWFWENQRFSLYSLTDTKTGYAEVSTSRLLPGLDIALLSQFIDYPSQTYRQALQK